MATGGRCCVLLLSMVIIIHQTHYEKSDWSRAFNQFTIACELDMINVTSAADITFIMSSSTSVWLLSPLECSPQKQNGWTLRFCFWGWINNIGKYLVSSGVKTCALDPLRSLLLTECFDTLLPVITRIVNLSPTTGNVPRHFKEAMVRPKLKKDSLDHQLFSHFRPISNLKLLS